MLTKLVAIGDRRTIKPILLGALAVVLVATAAAPASAATRPAPLLAQGAGMGAKPSPAVRSVQRVLRQHGYDLGRPGVDGRFGPLTAAAVRHLQSDYGLDADGIVGPKTRKLVRLLKTSTSAHGKPAPNKPAAKTPASKKPAAPNGTAKSPSTQPAPAQPTTTPQQQPALTSRDGSGDGTLIAILAAIAIAALAVALWPMARGARQKRRPQPAPAVAPIARDLYLEGYSEDPRVGDFRGHALAATIPEAQDDEPEPEGTSYLVDDVRKPAPVWVSGSDVQRTTSGLTPGAPVYGYVTVPGDAPPTYADEPAHRIQEACDRGRWELVEVVTDRENGQTLDRPGLTYALEQIADGKAQGLVVSELRRVSRSIADLGALMAWFRDARAALIALDLGVDTSTPAGREVAAAMVRVGEWERERAATRSRHALAPVRTGGRPAVADRPQLLERITMMREAKMTLQAIADQLNAEGVPTLRGGKMWRPSSVQAALGYKRPGARNNPRSDVPSLEDRRQS